jgi:hypothetical protein
MLIGRTFPGKKKKPMPIPRFHHSPLCEQIKQRIPGTIWEVLQSVHFLPVILLITPMGVKSSLTTTAFCPYRV